MTDIARMMSITLKEKMTITEIIDLLKHVEVECNQNNMYLHTNKMISFVDENAFKPIKINTTENKNIW